MASSPGEAAYEKWRERVDRGDIVMRSGRPMLQPWGALQAGTKATWEAVAQAAIKHAKGRG